MAPRGTRSRSLLAASVATLLVALPGPLGLLHTAPRPPAASPRVAGSGAHAEPIRAGMVSALNPRTPGCSSLGLPSTGCVPTGWSGVYPQPGARELSLLADDPTDHAMLLLGGESFELDAVRPLTYLEDFWQLSDGNWTELPLPPGFPSPLSAANAQLVYDASDGYVLLAGYFPSFETWSYSGAQWTQLSPMQVPALGYELHMTYDAADAYVLLLGYVESESAGNGTLWSFHAGNWTNLSDRAIPPPRLGESMAYDSADGCVVMTGGYDLMELTTVNDTWTYRAGTWKVLPTPTPFPARADATMIDDPTDDSLLFFGGTASPSFATNETWSYRNGTWSQLSPPQLPQERVSASGVFDSTVGEAVLFGGECAEEGLGAGGCSVGVYSNFADTWLFAGGNWTAVEPPLYPPSPVQVTYDGADGFVLAVSDCETVPGGIAATWSFAHGRWTPLLTAGCPGFGTEPPLLTYDPGLGSVIALVGNVTWVLTPGDQWFSLGLSHPAPPAVSPGDAVLVYDGWDGYPLLFVGENADPSGTLAETWAYRGGSWVNLTGSTGPSVRYGASMAYDPADHAVILFGGIAPFGSSLNDTWSFSGGHWNMLALPVSPPARESAAMVFDSASNHLVLFGGESDYGSPRYASHVQNDTWEFENGLWSNLTPARPMAPSARVGGGFVFDIADDYAVLIGTYSFAYPPELYGLVNATWIWNGSWARGAAPQFSYLGLTPNPDDEGHYLTLSVSVTGGAGPVRLSYHHLPAGCPASGSAFLSCAPTVVGTYSVVVNATDSRNISMSASVSLRVNSDPRVTLQLLSSAGVAGQPVNLTVLTQGGTPPFTFVFSGLPTGCLPGSRLTFNCTWSSRGNYTVSVNGTDALGLYSLASVSLTVRSAPSPGSKEPFWGLPSSDWLLLAAAATTGSAVAIGIYAARRKRGSS